MFGRKSGAEAINGGNAAERAKEDAIKYVMSKDEWDPVDEADLVERMGGVGAVQAFLAKHESTFDGLNNRELNGAIARAMLEEGYLTLDQFKGSFRQSAPRLVETVGSIRLKMALGKTSFSSEKGGSWEDAVDRAHADR